MSREDFSKTLQAVIDSIPEDFREIETSHCQIENHILESRYLWMEMFNAMKARRDEDE
jgi:hypothetical protein